VVGFPKSEAKRSGLLLEPPGFGGMVKFYHPSFQEFFAARELASRSDSEWGSSCPTTPKMTRLSKFSASSRRIYPSQAWRAQ